MKSKAWLSLAILLLGGCRLVSEKELNDLKSPPNPWLANVATIWQEKLVPQTVQMARPATELMTALQAEKDFDTACQKEGYRTQEENPCVFFVKVSGKIDSIDTTSRSGKMTLLEPDGQRAAVQIGPTIRGTTLRDGYKGLSYSDFNDQVLYGSFGRAINDQAMKMISAAQLKKGQNVEVYGVFSAWDIPTTLADITPAKISVIGGN
jgi:Predicted periplasmic lipoprotein